MAPNEGDGNGLAAVAGDGRAAAEAEENDEEEKDEEDMAGTPRPPAAAAAAAAGATAVRRGDVAGCGKGTTCPSSSCDDGGGATSGWLRHRLVLSAAAVGEGTGGRAGDGA